MKDYDKNKESSYVKYWDVNNLYGWVMSHKPPVNKFECIEDTSQLNEDFIKSYNDESNEGYFVEVDVQYPEKLQELHKDLPILPERIKLEKVKKLVANLQDKTQYAVHVIKLKQTLSHGFIFKKVPRVIKFNKKAWLKRYIDINTKLRQKSKNNFEKDLFKLMSNAVFEKAMENLRKHRDNKLITIERSKNYLVSEPNSHTTKFFTENLLAIEMTQTQTLMNKPVYLGVSILDLSKTAMYEFLYHYVKPKHGENAKLCYMDTGSFMVHVRIRDL